jgi:hypothetical protein
MGNSLSYNEEESLTKKEGGIDDNPELLFAKVQIGRRPSQQSVDIPVPKLDVSGGQELATTTDHQYPLSAPSKFSILKDLASLSPGTRRESDLSSPNIPNSSSLSSHHHHELEPAAVNERFAHPVCSLILGNRRLRNAEPRVTPLELQTNH